MAAAAAATAETCEDSMDWHGGQRQRAAKQVQLQTTAVARPAAAIEGSDDYNYGGGPGPAQSSELHRNDGGGNRGSDGHRTYLRA